MRSLYKYIVLLMLPLFFACDKDGDMIMLSGFQEGVLQATATEVALSAENNSTLVYTLMWNTSELAVSYPEKYGLPAAALTNTLQFSTDAAFTSPKESAETSSSKGYTGKALNALALSMGIEPAETKTIYIRIKSSIGTNIDPLYSNVVELSVTPYEEISYLYMPGINGDNGDFSVKLCSRSGNGEYEGFAEAKIWANFKFTTEPSLTTGTIYGSNPDNLYSLDPSESQWNIWFDEGGYFLLKASTNNLSWSKKAITAFAITGEFNGWSLTASPMNYDSAKKVWTATCNVTTVLYGIQIIANNDWGFAFGGANGELTQGSANIVIDQPGTYTITMDLSNSQKYTYSIK